MIYWAAFLVLATLAAMASGRVPAVLALGTGLAVAGLTGVAPPSELFSGLSNGGVITVAAMLVIAKSIVHTGVVSRVTWSLLSTATTGQQAMRRLMGPVGVGSALMNNTPIVAMLVPATKEMELTRRIPAREVLLPVAHVTTLAGSVTLIGTSSNLLVAGIASTNGVDLTMLSFAPIALPVALVGAVVLYFTAPLLLRGESQAQVNRKDWRVEIPVSSYAIALGRMPEDIGVAQTNHFQLECIERWGETLPATTAIEPDDILVFAATESGVAALWGSPRFGLSGQRLYEVSVSAGEYGTFQDLERGGDIRVIAAQTDKPLRDSAVSPGETCFVTGKSAEILRDHDGVAMWQKATSRAPQPRKTWIALTILAAVVISASLGLAAVELVAVSGAILMVLTRVITPTSAVRALDWNVLFILAGSVGLGAIVVSSGLADVISDAISDVSQGNVLLVVIVFVVTTAVMTNLVTNAATASILTPVGIAIAAQLSLNPVTILALIGTCISFTLINPFGHQSNLMVMGPGGYTFASFARFGVPVLLLSIVSATAIGYWLVSP
jgi:di/tricarboxylate transporter